MRPLLFANAVSPHDHVNMSQSSHHSFPAPRSVAACLARPRGKVISVSGDGGFVFSGEELETAVRLKCNFVHMIWRDGHYDMVAFQERMKYGRTSGCDFGPVDTVKYAEAFGAK